MPSIKRQSDEPELSSSTLKYQRTDENGDFSGAVRKKLSSASRTGQACDRCKVRKIRCDVRPGGCSPCLANNIECRTTDRITGRATSRGHTEVVETENATLKQYLVELRQQLEEHGIEARPPPTVHIASPPQNAGYEETSSQPSAEQGRSRSNPLPDFKPDAVGDNYLGAVSANESLSPIKGTSLALFGMELDIKDFVPDDGNDKTSCTSYRSFHDLIYLREPCEKPELPPYNQCKAFCDYFFKFMGGWSPVIHKPQFMDMVERVYRDPTFTLSASEECQLHTLLAIMLFQYTTRHGATHNSDWRAHFRWAMSLYPDITVRHNLENMKAIAMICLYLRGLPKPAAAWIMSSHALALITELGLHRSVKAWKSAGVQFDANEVEMRKRIFWSILECHVMVGVKLGRPLALRLEDIDVEFPEPVDDQIFPEDPKCSFRPAIWGFKWLPILMQIHNEIYSVKGSSSATYEATLKRIGKELDAWEASIPSEFKGYSQTSLEDRVFASYLDLGTQHLRLLLHHPSRCVSQNQELAARNLDICSEASAHLLRIAGDMMSLKSLDCTWQTSTVFLSAIFTTLFAFSERKDQMTSSDLKSLRKSMDAWLNIMGEIGMLLGSGPKLQKAVAKIIASSIAGISKHLATKTASAAVASAAVAGSPKHEERPEMPAYGSSGDVASFNSSNSNTVNGGGSVDMNPSGPSFVASSQHAAGPGQQQQVYGEPQYAYHEAMNYQTQPMAFDSTGYSHGDPMRPDITLPLQAAAQGVSVPTQQHFHPVHHNLLRQPQLPPHDPHAHTYLSFHGHSQLVAPGYNDGSGYAQQPQMHAVQQPPSSVAWRHFADTMMNKMDPHWGANALITLGHPQQKGVGANGVGVGGDGLGVDVEGQSAQWAPTGMMGAYQAQPGGSSQ